MDKEEELKDTNNTVSITETATTTTTTEVNEQTSVVLDSITATTPEQHSNEDDKRKSTLSEDSCCDSKDSDTDQNNTSTSSTVTSPSQRRKRTIGKEEKERIEQEKMRLKEEKERAKREEKEEKLKSKEEKKLGSSNSSSAPTLTREPSVISKIFSSKKSNSNNSLTIERSSSPTPVSLENNRKSFNESNSPSTENLANQSINNSSDETNTSTPTNDPSSGITTPSIESDQEVLSSSPIVSNSNNVEENSSATSTPTTQPPTAAVINNKDELSTSTSTNGKKDVVIKVTRAFAAVVHVNLLKEEGESKMRNKVINEIINTEKDYISDLQVIINTILVPLKESKIVTDKDISTIFSNIQLLLNVNKELLNGLEKAANETQGEFVGQHFTLFSQFLKMYSSYCANQKISSDHIALCSKKIPAFKQFIDEKQALPECRQCNLDSLLIKPVQRLCKYPLLIRELIKNSIENHPDNSYLEKAYESIQTVVLSVNENKRKAENDQKMYKIHEKLETSFEFDFLTPTRYLIREDTLRELTEEKDKVSGKMHYYLFNDIMMRTKKDKKSIKLETLFVIASTHVNGDENRNSNFCNTFEISQVGSTGRKFTLVADTYEQKMEWLTDLENLIRPHQEQSMREYEKLLDESPFQFKRTTIATSNPSNQPDSPKSLSRSVTASTLQSKTPHSIPSKPLPPPPKAASSPSVAKPNINQQPLSSPSTPTPNYNSNTTTPSSSPSANNLTSKLESAAVDSPAIIKPKPVGVVRKMTAPSIPATNNAQESSGSHSTFSTTRTVPRPISTTPSSVSPSTSTPETSSPAPVPKSNTRPLPLPGSFNQDTTTPTPTPKQNVPVPSKPAIPFPSKLSQLKSAPQLSGNNNNPTRSHSTFVPSSAPKIDPNLSQQSKDDSSIVNSTTTTTSTPPVVRPRVMPLPPKGTPPGSPSVNDEHKQSPKPLPIPSKKPMIPPRK
ncbi:hypothetical protein CYY_008619 [Polysphondylium violaceum]|uniref:Pleckstrin domain-containing protein n=1 Tax=Polysphondylium violaceum TaxID=133409 RepID=A0A8J4PLF0_9MYCE|nr:hypothetical protein CYY_008619 [Polysphondylium violaceum]